MLASQHEPGVLRLAFVVPGVYAFYAPDVCPPGGAERQAYLLGDALAARGDVEVQHLVGDFGQPERVNPRACVTLWRSRSNADGLLQSVQRVWRALRAMDADVYVFRSASAGVAVGMALVTIGLRRPVVYMLAHDHEARTGSIAPLIGWGSALAMALAYRLPRVVCAQTQAQAALFAAGRRRVVAGVVPNACPIPPPRADTPRRTVLWVGRALAWKRGESFLSLARALPECRFVMVCAPGDHAVEQRWREEAGRLTQLTWTGRLPHADLAAAYSEARLYVHTAESEGVPNAMLEALAAGCPVLSAQVDPNGVLEAQGAGRCLHALDDAALVQAARELLARDDDSLAAMGTRGQAYMRAVHAPDAVAAKLLALIRPLLAGGKGTPCAA